jgi:hypothetical protein
LEEKLRRELRSLALEVMVESHGQITYEGDSLVFNFEVTEGNIVLQFQWALVECQFEVFEILENGECKSKQYKNGQYEHSTLVTARLNFLNQRYRRKLRGAGLERFYSKGF